MIVYHATPLSNCESIERDGLCTVFAQGAERIWVARSPATIQRILPHLHKVHHHAPTEYYAIFTVNVPRSWLRRYGKVRGLYYICGDVPTERVWRYA